MAINLFLHLDNRNHRFFLISIKMRRRWKRKDENFQLKGKIYGTTESTQKQHFYPLAIIFLFFLFLFWSEQLKHRNTTEWNSYTFNLSLNKSLYLQYVYFLLWLCKGIFSFYSCCCSFNLYRCQEKISPTQFSLVSNRRQWLFAKLSFKM